MTEISLKGIIDMHVHAGPDLRERKMNAWQLAEKAQLKGMKGIVLKNHYTPTMLEASIISMKTEGFDFYGGITLNYSVGGLNPQAVEKAIDLGAKIIWMPTHDAENERAFNGLSGTGINLFNDNGKLRKEVYQILEQVKNAGIILATGHFSFPEVESLSKAAYEMNFDKILVNHPGIIFQRFSVEQQKELLKYGAFLEHSYCRPPHTLPVDELVHTLRQLDTEKIVLATDLGQPQNPDPVDGMEELISQLVRNGFTKSEIDQMVIENPAYLLCK